MKRSTFEKTLEVFYRLHDRVKEYDADGQAEIFAENGIWEFPFATGNMPLKVEGRESIRVFGKMGMEASKRAGRRIVKYNALTVHQTQHSDTIIVEFELEGEVMPQNIIFKIPYIQLVKVENGKVVLLRDYFSMEILKNLIETKATI